MSHNKFVSRLNSFLKDNNSVFLLCILVFYSVYVTAWVYAVYVQVSENTEEGAGSPGDRVTDSNKPAVLGAGNTTQIL